MPSKVKDLVEITDFSPREAEGRDEPSAVLSSFLLTYELGDALARVVERLVTSEGAGARNCLIVGYSGCGKTKMLSVVSALLEAPSSDGLQSRLAAIRSTANGTRTIVVSPSAHEASIPLVRAVERALRERFDAEAFPIRDVQAEPGQESTLDLIAEAVVSLPEGHRVVVAIDDLDVWLGVTGRYAYENLRTLARLGELSRTCSIATCAVAGDRILKDDSSSASGQGWIASLLDSYQIEYLPAHALRTATANRILRKNARQRREILDVLRELRERLPDLAYTDEEFAEMYPLEVSTWTIGSHLHRWIPGFSFPEFAVRAAESVKGRPAPSLFALNDMFALYESQLREVDALKPLFAAYDKLVIEALPRLGSSQRLWARLALQSLMMHSLAGLAVDVTTLTNSVLLYSLHGGGSSYAMMSAVLKQLETLGRGQLVASGDPSARRYMLVSGEREALEASITEVADQMADDDDELMWLLMRFGAHFFADWPFGALASSSRQRDLWEVKQEPGRIALKALGFAGRDPRESGDPARPLLVILAPGRSWSEARTEVERRENTSCWIGQVPLRAERNQLKRWLAVVRVAENDRTASLKDLDAMRVELEAQAAGVFKRVYIDGGTLVYSDRSEAVSQLVRDSREENLVVRLLPSAARVLRAATAATTQVSNATVEIVPDTDSIWLAHLTADTPDNVEAIAISHDPELWIKRLEAWYSIGVERDAAVPVRLLSGKSAEIAEVALGLEAKHLFGAVLYDARRALMVGSVRRMGRSLARVFETPERMWEARGHLEWLGRFGEWIQKLERADQYLKGAEHVADAKIKETARTLRESTDDLEPFVAEDAREAFEQKFEEYRSAYADSYVAKHDRSVKAEVIDRVCTALIESASWQTLETLSSLSIANQTYLVEAINLTSVLRDAQCDADVRAILYDRPTCVCGFRFVDGSRINAMAAGAAEFIQTGVEFHRKLLKDHRAELRTGLKERKRDFDLETMRKIAELTKEGPLPEVDQRMVDAINEILLPPPEEQAHG